MKKVAIVGFASSSRHMAPFNDPEFEIWTMNHAPISWIPTWHVLFEMHTLEHLRTVAAHSQDPNKYLDWLSKQTPEKGVIYMQDHYDQIPASVALPIAELDAMVGSLNSRDGYHSERYWTSTISYMIGMALLKEAPEIHLYGIDLLQEEEYFYQRSGAEYLIGLARGRGIPTFVPRQSALCRANYVYGYTRDPEQVVGVDHAKLRKTLEEVAAASDPVAAARRKLEELSTVTSELPTFAVFNDYVDDKAKFCETQISQAKQDAATFNGAMQLCDLVLTWLKEGKDVQKELVEKRTDLTKRFTTAHEGTFTMTGQAEAFKTVAIWGRHYARGGALER